MRILIASIFIFLNIISVNAIQQDDAKQLFSLANEKYAEGAYVEAIESYRQIAEAGFEAAELYYNLGNAFFKNKNYVSAILNYEKALKLDPAHIDARFNLRLANSKTVDRIDALPELEITKWWRSMVFSKKADDWGWMAINSLVLSLILFGAFMVTSRTALKKTGFYLGILFFIVAINAFVLGRQQVSYLTNTSHAIVFAPSLTVRSAPDNSGTKLFVIHEGTKVQVLESLSEWKKVSLPNGSIGWVKGDVLEVI
jgi:tetratricopeptide (TPR) repeat protein